MQRELLRISFGVCICLTIGFCLLYYTKINGLDSSKARTEGLELWKNASLKNAPSLSNYTQYSRVRLQNIKDTWLRVLESKPLKLGYSYSLKRSGVRYILGVPTVLRPVENYLVQTLSELVENMNDFQLDNCLIVVYIGETQAKRVQRIWEQISQNFHYYLNIGLIDVVAPPANYYPDFEQLTSNLQESPERARWRIKQSLDYMFLMTYASSRGDYYLQLEDDIRPNVGYLDYIMKYVTLQTYFRLALQRPWIVLSFCNLGFIGKLFRTEDLPSFLSFLQIFYKDQPIDWLLQAYVQLKSCRWDIIRYSGCAGSYSLGYILADQSQFQHSGVKSSLHNKEQQLRDRNTNRDSARQRFQHLRQPLNLIAAHKSTLMREKLHLQQGETFIWGYMPHISSVLRFMQQHQYEASQFRIHSGSLNRKNFTELTIDVLYKVPVLPVNSTQTSSLGFVMSYTHESNPLLLYYYVKEGDQSSRQSFWFRRFKWSGQGALLPDLSVQLSLLLWIYVY